MQQTEGNDHLVGGHLGRDVVDVSQELVAMMLPPVAEALRELVVDRERGDPPEGVGPSPHAGDPG
jgi:hypothetical protein